MLRLLVRLKAVADPDARTVLEGKMETLGFFPEDFKLDYPSLSAVQFEDLVGAGSIRVYC
jgi:hypothetical protein